ncbi:hypothetical protein [Arcobacter porcinus]|uniref:DUF2066 domain-containing protein n=1 Tax=Arcobacter porcinus TaxID=1935204 RepID=A0ABX2YAN6_9BACT|nr:hypothetical protein [Arcobacter porcinus]OCL85405.1 hypothetical protein AAX30_01907 [Arcobacter porcinus]OCL90802.1 hypothetical protein AAX28_01619 [Arcobacter porcinus]
MKWFSSLMLLLLLSHTSTLQAQQPPTLQDLVPLLASGATPEEIFDQAVLSHMRVPLEHLGVNITDRRNGRVISRDEIRHLLGQSRQDSAHQLIRQVFSNFQLPGYPNAETLINLLDAAALASLRSPPPWLDIEFYDQRVGSDGQPGGGVSGRIPEKIHQPDEKPAEQQTLAAKKAEWNEERVARVFILRGNVFETEGRNDFLLPLLGVAASPEALWQQAQVEFVELQQEQPEINLRVYNPQQPILDQVLLVEDGEQNLYALLVHFQSSDVELVKAARALFNTSDDIEPQIGPQGGLTR